MYTFIYFTSLVFKLCQKQFSQKAAILRGWHHPRYIQWYYIFLWHESEDINMKSLFRKFQLIPILRLQVKHDSCCVSLLHWLYCVKLSLIDETFCENCSHFILNDFSLIPLGNVLLRGELQKDAKIQILRVPSIQNQGVFLYTMKKPYHNVIHIHNFILSCCGLWNFDMGCTLFYLTQIDYNFEKELEILANNDYLQLDWLTPT